MTTLILIMVWMGFYMSYLASRKVHPLPSKSIKKWLHDRPIVAKVFAAILLCASIFFCIVHWGLGSGTLFFFVMLMTLGSLVVILRPLQIFNYKRMVMSCTLSLVIEYFIS